MSPVGLQLYRYSFWLAPTTALSVWHGTAAALAAPRYGWMLWWPVILIYGVVPLLDLLTGRVATRFSRAEQAALGADRMLRVIPWFCGASWLLVFAWALAVLPQLQGLSWPHWLGFVVSLGIVGGILAINVGHELIHRPHRAERAVGGLLLASVCYGVFKIEHVRGHHLRVATLDDTATARKGETAYAFVPRSIMGTWRHAWQIERERLQRAGVRGWAALAGNEAARWTALSLGLLAAVALWRGGAGVAVFLAASLVAVIELELVNYVEHYGLLRDRDANGTVEPVRYEHSWDYGGWLTNALLINLQRHSDHHAHGGRPFAALNAHPEAPQLPASYGTMLLLALVPPLYRRVVHPRLPV